MKCGCLAGLNNMILGFGAVLFCLIRLQASAPILKESFSRIAIENVKFRREYSTHKATSIAISPQIATLIGLIVDEAEMPSQEAVEFLFQPDMVKLQLRPDVPPGAPGFVVHLNVKSILVRQSLLKNEFFISSKIQMPPLKGINMDVLKWICVMEVKSRRTSLDGFGAALRAAGEYNLNASEGRYYYVRRSIKRLLEKYQSGLVTMNVIEHEIDSLKFSRKLMQLTSDQLKDLWKDVLGYNQRYCSSNVKIKWMLYIAIGKRLKLNPIEVFGPIGVLQIAEMILRDSVALDMIEYLKEPEIMCSISRTQKKSLVKLIRKQNYMDSSELAILVINLFRDVYTLDWIRSDILSLIILSYTSKRQWISTSAVQQFLQVMTEDYHGYLSEKWLKAFLQTIKIYMIQCGFEEWQGCGLFGVYLWTLYSHAPEFFMQTEWTTFINQKKNKVYPFTDLKDAVLEMATLVPCLTLKKVPNSPKLLPQSVPKIIQSALSQFKSIENYLLGKEGFKNMMMAIDYWLQVTGFCDMIILLNQDSDARPTTVSRVAKVLGKEIIQAFQHLVSLQKPFHYDPILVLLSLSKSKLSRVVLILIWSKAITLPQDPAFLIDFAENDLYGMAYAVWASRIISQSSLKATLESGSSAMLTSGNDSEAFVQVYNSLGQDLEDQCGKQMDIQEIVWHLPTCMTDGSISLESSIALIRTYLLLKFCVPFGVTRSTTTIVATDFLLPFEYVQFMNFWLERHYALTYQSSKKPAWRPRYKIVIDGVEEHDQK